MILVGTVTYARAMNELRDWCVAHGRPELLSSIRPNNIRKSIRAVPGFEEVAEAGRPHGEQRRMARIRLRKFNESVEEEDSKGGQKGGSLNHVNRIEPPKPAFLGLLF